MSLSIVLFPYARADGLGRVMKDQTGWRQVALASVTRLAASALAGAWPGGGYLGWAAMALAALLTWIIARLVLALIPGLTGDIYGALGEALELAALLLFAIAA